MHCHYRINRLSRICCFDLLNLLSPVYPTRFNALIKHRKWHLQGGSYPF